MTPLALVVSRPGKLGASSDSSGEVAESRIKLYWQDSHRLDPEGLVLADADGEVLDIAMFRDLRDQLGAWIDCAGQDVEVLQALHFASQRADEPGIGAPPF